MGLTNREKSLIIFAILLAVFIGYFSFVFRPLYTSYSLEKDKKSELEFELATLNQSVESVNYLVEYNSRLMDKKREIDVFQKYLNNEDIEKYMIDKSKVFGYEVIGFMTTIDSDVRMTESLKRGIDKLTVKYITVTFKGGLSNLGNFLKEIEKNKFIEIKELQYFKNRNIENDESITIEFCYLLKDRVS